MVKIIRDTPDETVIEDRPWILGLVLSSATVGATALLFHAWDISNLGLAAASLCLGLGAFWSIDVAIKLSRLTLSADGTAILSVRDRKGWKHRRFTRGALRAAVETNRQSDGDTTRAVLLIDTASGTERIPLTAYFSSSATDEKAVDRINAWARPGP